MEGSIDEERPDDSIDVAPVGGNFCINIKTFFKSIKINSVRKYSQKILIRNTFIQQKVYYN